MHLLIGRSIRLRSAREDDACFILRLRLDERLNKFLSRVDNDIEQQRKWLREYQLREEAGSEYYFIIEAHTGEPYGTVRLYDMRDNKFSWGSWILTDSRPQSAAIESTIAVYDFGFHELKYENSHFDVRRQNEKVVRYHERFGARRTSEDDLNIYFELSRREYEHIRPKYSRYFPDS